MRRIPFWKNKSIFVTGHTGFKGSWLCLWLQLMKAKVTGFALSPPTAPHMFGICDVARQMNSIHGDICNLDALTEALRRSKAEIVFHLAAQSIVRQSYDDPVGTFNTNMMGSVNVLEAVRRCGGVKAIVMVTTDKCYVNHEWFWSYREKSQLGGDDPYSASKACAELAIAAYRKSFFDPGKFAQHGVGLASCRAGNVIGGGDWAKDRIVPDVMRSLMSGKRLQLRNPHSTRPWQHVLDPLNGYLMLAESLYNDGPQFASAWNFGPFESSERNVAWIVAQLHAIWGGDHKWERESSLAAPHESKYLKLDSSKARSLLGWSPKLDLLTALRWITNWTKAHQSGAQMRALTEGQIMEFMNRHAVEPMSEFSARNEPLPAQEPDRSRRSKAKSGMATMVALPVADEMFVTLEQLSPFVL